jgi:hypothetical protein
MIRKIVDKNTWFISYTDTNPVRYSEGWVSAGERLDLGWPNNDLFYTEAEWLEKCAEYGIEPIPPLGPETE